MYVRLFVYLSTICHSVRLSHAFHLRHIGNIRGLNCEERYKKLVDGIKELNER